MRTLFWYNKLGFFSNPFSIKPAAFHNELFGNSDVISEIVKKTSERGVIFVSGEFGTGKTTVLKRLIAKLRSGFFKGKKVIYYNCNRSERSIDYDSLLIGAGNFVGKLFRIRKRNMIILLDEMQDMNKRDLERVKDYYDREFFKTVVLVSKRENLELTEELKMEIGSDGFRLGDMSDDEAVEMVRKRIGDLKLLSDEMILEIFRKDKNSRNFLKNCEDVCRVAFESRNLEVLDEHVLKVLK